MLLSHASEASGVVDLSHKGFRRYTIENNTPTSIQAMRSQHSQSVLLSSHILELSLIQERAGELAMAAVSNLSQPILLKFQAGVVQTGQSP